MIDCFLLEWIQRLSSLLLSNANYHHHITMSRNKRRHSFFYLLVYSRHQESSTIFEIFLTDWYFQMKMYYYWYFRRVHPEFMILDAESGIGKIERLLPKIPCHCDVIVTVCIRQQNRGQSSASLPKKSNNHPDMQSKDWQGHRWRGVTQYRWYSTSIFFATICSCRINYFISYFRDFLNSYWLSISWRSFIFFAMSNCWCRCNVMIEINN